jgi:late competence protein required for DNA uptake (superfamily II DNA/RNA helicase)
MKSYLKMCFQKKNQVSSDLHGLVLYCYLCIERKRVRERRERRERSD